jgi:hypothetical protein
MTGTDDEKKEKYIEYKIKLTDVDRLFDHKKASEAIDILKEFSSNSTKPFESDILSDRELMELTEKYPKSRQNELKQKWSYQSLLRDLAKDYPEYKAQLGTLATYSRESHLCHYDWTGVSNRNAQIIKSTNPKTVMIDITNSICILSNVISLEWLRVAEYIRGNKFNVPEVIALSNEVMNFVVELDSIYNGLLEKNAHLANS